jgi:HPt (histidine-containing phosphotransfer) domain-containing protein
MTSIQHRAAAKNALADTDEPDVSDVHPAKSAPAKPPQTRSRRTQATSGADLSSKALVAGPRFDVRGADVDLTATLSLMAPEISDWFETTCADLQQSLATYVVEGGRVPRELMHHLHELRGQAGTMGFPLVSRVAAALQRLLEMERGPPPDVLTAHIDAIRAIVSENAKAMTSELAIALVDALEEFGRIWSSPDFGNGSESSFC